MIATILENKTKNIPIIMQGFVYYIYMQGGNREYSPEQQLAT